MSHGTVVALEVIAVHAVLALDVADHRLDGGAAPHLAADRFGDAAHLARGPDPERVRVTTQLPQEPRPMTRSGACFCLP